MVGDEPKVEIGLREVYDKVNETNVSVQLFNQRITAVESDQKELKSNQTWLWRTLVVTVLSAAGYAIFNHK